MKEILKYILKEYEDNPVKTIAATIVIIGSISGFAFFIINNLIHQEAPMPEINNIITSPINGSKPVIANANVSDDDQLADDFTRVAKPNSPPTIYELSSDKNNLQIAGTTITWTADALDPDDDQILYRFSLNNNPVTDWRTDNTWTWATSKDDVGDNNRIMVCVRDGKHVSLDNYDNCKSVLFTVSSPADTGTKNQVGAQVRDSKHASQEIISTNPVVVSSSSTRNGFTRTNEYVKNGVEPNCEPESKQAICSAQESCVDCNGKCWPPGSYDSGNTRCSQGKWTLSWTEHTYR